MSESGHPCEKCGNGLSPGHEGPCPVCGFAPSVMVENPVASVVTSVGARWKHKDGSGTELARGKYDETKSGVTGHRATQKYTYDHQANRYVQEFAERLPDGSIEVTHTEDIPETIKPDTEWLQEEFKAIARGIGVQRYDRKHVLYDDPSAAVFLDVGQSRHRFAFPLSEIQKAKAGETVAVAQVRAVLTAAANAVD